MANVVASEPWSHALERRLRRRRQEARLRLRLVADCAVPQSHHASAAPAMPAQGSLRSELGLLRTLVEELREELAAMRREADLAGAPVAKTAADVSTVEEVAALDANGKAGEETATVAEVVVDANRSAGPDAVEATPAVVGDAEYAKMDIVAPLTIEAGSFTALVGSGLVAEDVTCGKLTIKPRGASLSSCEGEGAQEFVCKLPLGAGAITGKEVAFPLAEGCRVPVSGAVQTSLLLSSGLASVDAAVRATDQHGVSMDVGVTPAVVPVVCRNCLGTGRTLFGDCVICRKRRCVEIERGL